MSYPCTVRDRLDRYSTEYYSESRRHSPRISSAVKLFDKALEITRPMTMITRDDHAGLDGSFSLPDQIDALPSGLSAHTLETASDTMEVNAEKPDLRCKHLILLSSLFGFQDWPCSHLQCVVVVQGFCGKLRSFVESLQVS